MFRKEPQNITLLTIKRRFVSGVVVGVLVDAVSLWLQHSGAEHNLNWQHWITGKSMSSDFHYLDLLELLFRLKDSSDA